MKGGYRPHDRLTLEQAAEEFNVSHRSLRHAISERKLESFKPGRYVMVKWIDVDNWIEYSKRPAVRR